MSKKTRFLSVVLALMMIVPMFSAFAVVGEAAAVSYDSAAVGDLLYTANFNGDDVWSPAKNDWGSMNTSISSDGSTATFSSTTAYKNGWGGELSGFTVGNRSYTIIFTATSVYNEGIHIGISLNRDGGRGYLLVTPGRDRYALGWYNSYQTKKAFGGYDHSQSAGTNIPRTYAIEVAADGDGNATKYTLYVQDGSDWVEIYDMTDFSNFNWDSGSALLSLDFVKYLAGSKGTNAVDDYNNGSDRKSSVSNVKIYKGIGLTTGGAYYTAQNGDKLEDVVFSSDVDDYICLDVLYGSTAAGSSTYDDIPVTVADDGKSITFTTNSTGSKRSVFGHANSYPLSSGSKYTVYFTADIGTGMRMGFYHDTQHGLAFWEDSSNTRYMSWSSEQAGHVDSNLNYKNKTDFGSSVKEFAVEIDYNAGTLSLYGRNQNGLYSLINQAYDVSFDSDTLYTAFWVGNKSGAASGSKVTISNVSIYKGLTVETYDDVEFGLDAYNAAAIRSLLRTVDFDEAGWNPGFASDSNSGANVAISDGGNTVQFTVLTSSSSRAMWGARPVNPLPLAGGVEYTYLFDLTFGNTNVGFGLQLDGDNYLLIGGDGSTRLYNWNTAGTSGSNWANEIDIPSTSKQTFALEVDYANRKYNLFVKDSGGGFHSVASLTVPDWTDTPFTNLLLDVRKIGGTANSTYTATVSNMRIYKGLNLASGGYLTPYSDLKDGALIKDVNFTETDDFAPAVIDDDGYNDITATLSNGGSTLTLKGTADGNHRGIWKDAFAPELPLTSGVQYTFYFHLQMDSNMRFAFYPDGQQGMAIVQNNTYCGYQEWASLTTDTQMNWGNKTDAGTNLQDFAIELDYDAGTMDLYGQNINGTYCLINSIEISSWNSDVLMCAFYAGNTSGKKVVISDFSIYKGLTVETLDRSAIGFNYYDSIADGALLKAVNFSEAGWDPEFADENNKGADVQILSGSSVQFTIQNANNRRAMWGNDLTTNLPMHGDANYFFTFDLTFGNENVGFAIYPDNNNGLLIAGNGKVEWYEWNNSKVGTTYRWTEDQFYDGKEAVGETHSFAVKMNYASRSFALYILTADGTYALVASKTYSGAWAGYTTMKMRLYVRSMNNTADGSYTVKVDNLKIFKGLFYAANINKGLVYDPEADAYDFIDVMDFNDLDGVVYDSDSYNDVVPTVSSDGKSVTLLMQKNDADNYDYGRAFWGNVISPSLPLTQGVVYTFVYTVEFGDPEMLVGIYPDTSNGIVVKGDGSLYLMDWNNVRTTFGTHWDGKTDVEGMTQTFAIVMDYTAKEFSVYIKKSNATFAYVTGTTMKEGRNWDRVDQMECQIFVKYSDYNAMDDAERENYKVTVSNLSIYKGDSFAKRNVLELVNGAQTRTATDTTGLRFTSKIGKTLLDGLVDQYGDANVKVGMLITPTDYVNVVDGVFTKEALEAEYGSYYWDNQNNPTKYPLGSANGFPYIRVQLPLSAFGTDATVDTSDPYAYIIRFAITNLAATNQNREFSSTVYIEVLDKNTHEPLETYYSTYAPEDNSRSVAYVSALALNDVSASKVNEYKYSYNGGYSPYTENQRGVLSGFSTPYTVSVMQYNVEMYSTSSSNPGWEDGRDPTDAMNTILNNAPDIVTLDEIDSTQTSAYDSNLRKTTNRWGYYEKMLTDGGYSRVQGDTSQDMWEDIFYKTSRYNMVTSGKQKFKDYYKSVTNSESADTSLDDKYRSWTYAYLTDKTTGQKLLVIATHLHYGGTGSGHEADDTLRRYEIAILNYWVGTQDPENYDYIILAGDMNSDYRSGTGKAAINLYKNYGFALTNEEAAVAKEVSEDVETTLAVNGHSELSQYVFDYIMTIGNVGTIYYEAFDNPSANGVYPSDHLPIMAKMVLNK